MMKNRQLHTIILPLCTLLLFSCTQDTISPASDTENEIRFQTGAPTRGLIDDLSQAGTKITLYGYHGDNVLASTKNPLAGKSLTYMDGRWAVIDDTDTQNPNKPITYFWEGQDNNPYRFFGWLKQDPNELQAPTESDKWETEYKDNTLTVEATLDQSYNQFDFMYSDVDERTLDENNKREPVELNMHHLFSAFSISISNNSKEDIKVRRVILRHLYREGKAEIDFKKANDAQDKVIYTPTTPEDDDNTNVDETIFMSYNGGDNGYIVPKEKGLKNNIFSTSASSREFYMVWPQNKTAISPHNFVNEKAEEDANLGEERYPLTLEYSIITYDNNGNEKEGDPIIKKMQFPKEDWLPGLKHSYDVLIAEKLVQLNASVNPWNYSSSNIDFSDITDKGTVITGEANRLNWTVGTPNNNNEVKVLPGQYVEGAFTISAPVGGQWGVSLVGNIDAFQIVDDAAPVNDGLGPIDGKRHHIKIVPTIMTPTDDYKVQLKFVVITADRTTYSVDNEVQGGKTYTIVLERTN